MPNALRIKKFLLFILALEIFFAQANMVLAQEKVPDYRESGVQAQIKALLCAPSDTPKDLKTTIPQNRDGSITLIPGDNLEALRNTGGNDLYNCINKMYRFAIVLGASVGVFYIVIGGFLYMNSGGSQETVDKGKSMMVSSLTAMVILFAGYILLRALNPDLIKFQNIQPSSVVFRGSTDTSSTGTLSVSFSEQASRIANNPKIDLAKVHSETPLDNATAYQNIQDAAAGKPASLSNFKNAKGGSVILNANMLKTLADIGDKYKIKVSEIAGGSHSVNSNHYKGNAFDINFINDTHLTSINIPGAKEIMAMCRAAGATDPMDETSSANHIHCGGFPAVQTTSGPSGGQCNVLTSGAGSLTNLRNSCFGTNAERASMIANKESTGNATAVSTIDKCQPGGEPVSFGLFQINISANKVAGLDCPKAFDKKYTADSKTCKIINQPLYEQCKRAALIESDNIKAACAITKNGTDWSPYNNACPTAGRTTSTTPIPTTTQAPDINKIIKPWTGPDPYPNTVWDNTKPELKTAYEAFNREWVAQGNKTLVVRQVYRPKAYQDHIRSIWEAWRLRNNNTSTEGYRCNEITHLTKADVANMDAAQINILNSEVNKHNTATEKTPPACYSDHSEGIAIDITPPAVTGAVYRKWIETGNSVGLCHYIAGDQPHFALKSELPNGTDCLVE